MASGVYKVTAGGDVILTAPFIVRTPDPTLGNEFALDSIADGILKHTAGTPATATAGTDYVLPTGVAGGQTIIGGTAASQNLTLKGTAHATPGEVQVDGGVLRVKGGAAGVDRVVFGASGLTSNIGIGTGGVYGFEHFGTDMLITTDNISETAVLRLNGTGGTRVESVNGFLSVQTGEGLELQGGTPYGPRFSVDNGGLLNLPATTYTDTASRVKQTSTFAPVGGTATFRGHEINYAVNQTGGATGTVTGILLNATETAVGGTHNLMNLQVGGASRLVVTNGGTVRAGSGGAGAPSYSFTAATAAGVRLNGNDVELSSADGTVRVVASQASGGVNMGALNLTGIRAGDITGAADTTNNLTITGGRGARPDSVLFQIANSLSATSGTQRFIRMDTSASVGTAGFAPTSGTAAFRALDLIYVINQTGGANGAVHGIRVAATETALGGTHTLLDLLVGGTSRFRVDNAGSARIRAVDYTWPAAQGGAATVLTNDGAGNLAWSVGAAATGVLARFAFTGPTLLFPLTADWTVNAFADGANDTLNDLIGVARYDDTTEEGRGMQVYIPATAANLLVRVVGRAQTAPGGAANIQMRLYTRQRADNAATGAWSSAFEMNVKAIPTTTNWQYFEQTISLAALGLTAGRVTTLELTRRTSGVTDNLTGDFTVSDVVVEVTT